MIDGLFFLVACVAIGLLVTWMRQNDRVGRNGRTTGFFAMPPGNAVDSAETGKRKPGTRRDSPRDS